MAKYIDLDPDHRATLVVNIAALDIAAKLLMAAADRKITLPKNLDQDQWTKYLHQKAIARLQDQQISIEDFCKTVDHYIANDDGTDNPKRHTFHSSKSDLN